MTTKYLHAAKTSAVLASFAAACMFAGATAANAVTLNGAGATFPAPIYMKWFQAYHELHPDVSFNYQAVGSGAGIATYKSGTVDFGATDAPLSNAEWASMPQATVHIVTVAGAVVLAYHIHGVGPGLRLTGPVISDIYLGDITRWNDRRIQTLNPDIPLPDEAIIVAHRADGSGTTNIFTNYLSSVSPQWRANVGAGKSVNWPVGLGGKGNPGVAGLVLHSEGGFGYIELAYAVENHLPYGPVRNRAGNYVLASVASTSHAADASAALLARDVRSPIVNAPGINSYPICGFTFLLVPRHWRDAAREQAMMGFLRWALAGPGQQMAEGLLYAPLPEGVRAVDARTLATVRVAQR